MRRLAGGVVLLLMTAALGKAAATEGAAADAVQVVVKKPTVENQVLDPAKPPAELAQLDKESAACVAKSQCQVEYSTEVASREQVGKEWKVTVRVTRVRVVVGLTSVIWLPKGAPAVLVAHEAGHRTINERVYAGAKAAAEAAGRECLAETYTGSGPTPAAAQNAAVGLAGQKLMSGYERRMPAVWRRVNDEYDRITAHGANFDITSAAAVEKSLQAVADTQPASQPSGTQPGK